MHKAILNKMEPLMYFLRTALTLLSFTLVASSCSASPSKQSEIEAKLVTMFNQFAFDSDLPQVIYRPAGKFRGYISNIDGCYKQMVGDRFYESHLFDIIKYPIGYSFQYDGFKEYESYGAYGCPVPNEPNIHFKTILARDRQEYDLLKSRLTILPGTIVRDKQRNNLDICHIHIDTKDHLITGSTTIVLWPYGMRVPEESRTEVACITVGMLASMGLMGALSVPDAWLVAAELEKGIKRGFGVFTEPIGVQLYYEARLKAGMTKAQAEKIVRPMGIFSTYVKKFEHAATLKTQ